MNTQQKPQAQVTIPQAPQVKVPTGLETANATFEQPRPEKLLPAPRKQGTTPIVVKKGQTLAQSLEALANTKMTVVTYSSEVAKWRPLAARYLRGNGIELATGGDPILPTSIQFELTPATYAVYNSNQPLRGPVHWRSDTAVQELPFKDGVLDYVASSHLLEDFAEWMPLLTEWVRVLKSGGRLLVALPDKKRWEAAVAGGQCPNCAHKHEAYVGELSSYAPKLGLSVLCDKLTECPPGDYNILFVAEKL